MDYNLSIKFYKVFYKNALIGREVANQTSPKCINRVEELQQMCRVCGCPDDGTFVALDAYQHFEFEPSICSYRILLQRSSLQFQFNTMPDLPQRICARCTYKAKIFYLMTRQFVLGQNTMRSTVTKWYRAKYNVEPPELPEDRKQLKKQLVAIQESPATAPAPPAAAGATAAELSRRQQFQSLTYTTKKPLTSVKELIKACVGPKRKQLTRSISAETCLDEGTLIADTRKKTAQAKDAARRLNPNGCRTARSTVNLKPNPNRIILKKDTARGTIVGSQNVKQLKSTTARAGTLTGIGIGTGTVAGAGRVGKGNTAKAATMSTRGTKSVDGTQAGTETVAEGTPSKMTGRITGGAAAAAPNHTVRSSRSDQPKSPQVVRREHISRRKLSKNNDSFITPRASPVRAPKVVSDSPRPTANQDQSLRTDMPLSKAQLQRRLQERCKQWR